MGRKELDTNWPKITKTMKDINKIFVKHSVKYYSKAWKHRNDILHSNEVYRKYVIEWNSNLVSMIQTGNKPEMRKYLRTYVIKVDNCTNSYIQKWNVQAYEMYMKAEKEETRDIRMFFRTV